jgi:hypothetical protein
VDIQISTDGEQPIVKLRLTGTLIYRMAENAPDQAWD